MIKKEYYTLAELLENDYFVSSVHHPDAESEAYWKALIAEGKVNRDDYELAQHYIHNLGANNQSLTKEEIAGMWTTIYMEGRNRRKNKIRRLNILSFAAACLLTITGFFFFERYHRLPAEDNITDNFDISKVAPPKYNGDDIRIVLSDDNHIVVEENNSEIIYNNQGEARVNSSVVKKATEEEKETNAGKFNQVIVPRGRFSSLILSDGTKLWLNAYSRVVYPPVFSGNNREIYIEGEAYIEVTHDCNRPFIVRTNCMEVEVLGTEFNISAYENEEVQSVVLVSGSVSVQPKSQTGEKNQEKITISPSQLFRFSDGVAEIKTVNVNKYISWKNGYLWLESEPMSHIFTRLSNYYGIEIEYEERVGRMKYSGKLDLKNSPDRVLSGLENTEAIRLETRGNTYYMNYNP